MKENNNQWVERQSKESHPNGAENEVKKENGP